MKGSFNYLVPALFLNATVQTVQDLGTLSTGGGLALGHVISAKLYSEPVHTLLHGDDVLTADPTDGISRPGLNAIWAPDDGSTPFQMLVSGIQFPSPELARIVATNTSTGLKIPYGSVYSVWAPVFRGGSAKFANMQNSVLVGSETVSDTDRDGEFAVGIKISKVFCTNTSVVIGQEFP